MKPITTPTTRSAKPADGFKAGYTSKGKPVQNPFEPGTPEHVEWQENFEDGEMEYSINHTKVSESQGSQANASFTRAKDINRLASLKADRKIIAACRSSQEQADALDDIDVQIDRLTRKLSSSKSQPTNESVNHLGEREYRTYAGWKAACKKAYPGCGFRGDKDIGAATLDGKDVGEWDGSVGSVYVKRVNEVSKTTLGSYIKKASEQASAAAGRSAYKVGKGEYVEMNGEVDDAKLNKRLKGISKAVDKLTENDSVIVELMDMLALVEETRTTFAFRRGVKDAKRNPKATNPYGDHHVARGTDDMVKRSVEWDKGFKSVTSKPLDEDVNPQDKPNDRNTHTNMRDDSISDVLNAQSAAKLGLSQYQAFLKMLRNKKGSSYSTKIHRLAQQKNITVGESAESLGQTLVESVGTDASMIICESISHVIVNLLNTIQTERPIPQTFAGNQIASLAAYLAGIELLASNPNIPAGVRDYLASVTVQNGQISGTHLIAKVGQIGNERNENVRNSLLATMQAYNDDPTNSQAARSLTQFLQKLRMIVDRVANTSPVVKI